MKTLLNNRSTGFTLIETLVAITVLLLVIIGPMTIAQKGIQNASYANEQITAVFLAQEAIEAVQELRDNVALDAYSVNPGLKTNSWFTNALQSCGLTVSGTGCAFIATGGANSFTFCNSSNNNCKLLIDSSGKYVHSGGAATPFTRKVFFDDTYLASNGAVLVTVDVEWSNRIFSSSRHVILQTWIYDHYQRYEN